MSEAIAWALLILATMTASQRFDARIKKQNADLQSKMMDESPAASNRR